MMQKKKISNMGYMKILLAFICGLLATIWVFNEISRNLTGFLQNMSLGLVYGLTFSMLLFLMTSGFFLIFGLADVINFAHGAFFMLGGFIGYESYLIAESILLSIPFLSDNWFLLSLFSFIAALIGAALIMALIGAGIEFFTIRRLYGNPIGQILLTVGFLYIIQQVCEIFWGPRIKSYDYITGSAVRQFWLPRSSTLEIGGVQFEIFRVFIIFFGLILALTMFLVISKTRIGIIIQAGIEDAEMVQALGIDTKMIFSLVFITGAALAGVAGAVAIPLINANVEVAGSFLIYAFVIVVIGGAHYGRFEGTFFASLIAGLSITICQFFFPGFEGLIIFIILALVLVFKPGGLTGEPM
jgi:branched-chain amino acid transport system permease protein